MDSSLSISDEGNVGEVVAHSGDADGSDLGKEETSLTASKSSPDPPADPNSVIDNDDDNNDNGDDDNGERDRPKAPPLPELPPSPVDEVGYRVIANQAAAGETVVA